MGGSDQWGNIVAGVELIRKVRQETVFGITFPLITTISGEKMGKTAEGAVWLDPARTSPYEYYQYWINTDDRDVERFMALFTFLPMDEIRAIRLLKDADLNNAKSVLAFEATLLAHGIEEANKAHHAAANMFGARIVPKEILPSSTIPRGEGSLKIKVHDTVTINDTAAVSVFEEISVPHTIMDKEQLKEGIPAFKLYHMVGLASSGSAARRLIEQGGAYVNGMRIESYDYLLTDRDIVDLEILLRAGKKRYHKIKLIKNNQKKT
jgi:tyrosyl-tRNA synthetase